MLERRDLTKRLPTSYFFVGSLGRGEVFMMDASGSWHHIEKVRKGPLAHVVMPLVGRFKGENGGRHHLVICIINTLYFSELLRGLYLL